MVLGAMEKKWKVGKSGWVIQIELDGLAFLLTLFMG